MIPQSYFSDLLSGLEHNPGLQSSLLPTTSMRHSPLPFTIAAHAVATPYAIPGPMRVVCIRVRGVRPVSTRQKGPGVHSAACIRGTPGQTARPFQEMGWCIPTQSVKSSQWGAVPTLERPDLKAPYVASLAVHTRTGTAASIAAPRYASRRP